MSAVPIASTISYRRANSARMYQAPIGRRHVRERGGDADRAISFSSLSVA